MKMVYLQVLGVRKMLVGLFLSVCILALSACQTLKVDTFNKSYAAGISVLSVVYSVTANGVEMGKISKDDGRKILQEADRVRNLFGTARIAYLSGSDGDGGATSLNFAIAALTVLQHELDNVLKM